MVAKLSTTINKIQTLPNSFNSKIISEFLMYMKNNCTSERHQNNNLNVLFEFSWIVIDCIKPKTMRFKFNSKICNNNL